MDRELEHIVNEVGITGSGRRALVTYEIGSIDALLNAQEKISNAIELREGDKLKLLAVVRWRLANLDVNITADFDDASIEKFLGVEQTLSPTVDKEWNHICNIIGLPRGSREKLEREGVQTLQGLMEFQPNLESDSYKPNIWETELWKEAKEKEIELWKEAKEKLLLVIKWRQQNESADIVNEFTATSYETMMTHQIIIKTYIDQALGQPFRESLGPLYTSIREKNLLDDVIKKCQRIIMASSNLREQCGKFDYDTFIDKIIRHLHSLNEDQTEEAMVLIEKLIVIAGRTQSGKSAVKGVIQSLAGMLKLPLIILTKGVDESIDLRIKLRNMAEGTTMQSKHVVVASTKGDRLGYRMKDNEIFEAIDGITHGGTLVVADTHQQVLNKACIAIKKFRERLPGGKFILVVDEADAMLRTKAGSQVFEQALQQLINLEPCMRVMISATPVPFMLQLVNLGIEKDDIDFFGLDPSEDYVGIEDLRPLQMEGKEVFLEHDELTKSSAVPYTNEKVFALYNDAVSRRAGTKGVLLLDISSPYVTADGNVKQKAKAVQRKLLDDKGVDIVVIIYTASGLSFKVPGKKWEHDQFRKSTVGPLLNFIDTKYGLAMPVFIFGYTKMRRGVSFRSTRRVPTHMVMSLGKGHHVSTIVQTAGRATFRGRNVLNDNGFKSVTVLMPRTDHSVVVNYQRYIDHVNKRIKCGDSFAEAMTGANELVPDTANFLRETFRELGAIKGERREFMNRVQHEEPKGLSANEKAVRAKFWDDENAQNLLRSIVRLQKGHYKFHVDDAREDLAEAEGLTLSKQKVNGLLSQFVQGTLIDRDPENGKGWYLVTKINRNRLVHFMNAEFGWMPDDAGADDGFEYDSSDDDNDSSIEPESEPPLPAAVTETSTDASDSEVHHQGSVRPAHNTPSTKRSNKPADGYHVHVVTPPAGVGTVESPVEFSDTDDEFEASPPVRSKKRASKASDNGLKKQRIVSQPIVNTNVTQHIERIAILDGSNVMFGDVVGRYDGLKSWWIQWDDETNAVYGEKDLHKGFRLYTAHQSNDTSRDFLEARASRYGSTNDIPMVSPEDDFMTGKCIVQPNFNRRVYYAASGETPSKIATKFKLMAREIVEMNKPRDGYKYINQKSEITINNSPILLPL